MFSLIKQYGPLLFLAFSIIFLSKVLLLDYFPDFAAYYYGAEIALAGENPFPDNENYHTPNAYPMFVYLLFSPFTVFSFFVAQKVWVLLSLIFLLISFYLTFKINKKNFFGSENLLITGLILLTFFPTKFTLGMAQINIFILFLTVLFIYFFHQKKEKLAAFFLGVSIAAKFFPLLLLVFFIMKRKFRIVAYTILVFIAANLLGILFFGIDYTLYFYGTILPDLLSGWKGDYYNQALSGLLTRGVADIGLRNILKVIISGLLLLVTLVVIFKKDKNKIQYDNLLISLVLTLSVIINTFSWQHHFVWLLFPFLSIYLHLRDKKYTIKYFVILLISYVMVALNFKNPEILPSILQSHVLFGALILWGLNLYIIINKKVK